MLARLRDAGDRLEEAFMIVALAGMTLLTFVQVVLRYVFDSPSSWLDEFAVLAFAWMTLIGAAVLQRTDSHLSIDLAVKKLPPCGQAAVYALRVVAIVSVLGVLFWEGLALTRQMWFIEYPAMEISRGFLFAILPVCTPLILFYALVCGRRRIRQALNGQRIFGVSSR
jgi:C4-dicarboxylate transporter DctQ subunit